MGGGAQTKTSSITLYEEARALTTVRGAGYNSRAMPATTPSFFFILTYNAINLVHAAQKSETTFARNMLIVF